MGFFSNLFGGGKKTSSTNVGAQAPQIYDPLAGPRSAVASPLSKYLASQVDVGLGEFPTDPALTNRVSEFLAISPSDYFTREIQGPATQLYKEDIAPLIREKFAGSLRGSGRFGAEEAGINRFSLGLAQQRAEFVPAIAQAQISVGQSEFERQYKNWYNSLPQSNPALGQAIQFIGATMGSPGNVIPSFGGTGTTVTEGRDWLGELFSAALKVGAAYASSAF